MEDNKASYTEQALLNLINKTYKAELIWCSLINAAVGAVVSIALACLISSFASSYNYRIVKVEAHSGTAVFGNGNNDISTEITYNIPPELIDDLAERIVNILKAE